MDALTAWLNHIGIAVNAWAAQVGGDEAVLMLGAFFVLTLPTIALISYLSGITADKVDNFLEKIKSVLHYTFGWRKKK